MLKNIKLPLQWYKHNRKIKSNLFLCNCGECQIYQIASIKIWIFVYGSSVDLAVKLKACSNWKTNFMWTVKDIFSYCDSQWISLLIEKIHSFFYFDSINIFQNHSLGLSVEKLRIQDNHKRGDWDWQYAVLVLSWFWIAGQKAWNAKRSQLPDHLSIKFVLYVWMS